jgi:hypothetical protein
MRKTLVILFVFFLPVAAAYPNNTHFEVFGAYNQMAMTDYNKYITNVNDIYQLFGIDAKFQKLNTALVTEASWVSVLSSENSGDWGIYARAGRLNLFDDKSKATWPDGTAFETVSSDYSVFYSGLGLRKYVGIFFVGADAGAYYSWNSKVKDVIYFPSDGYSFTFERTWNTMLPGFNLEGGADFWLSDFFGLAIRAGYRYCKGKIAVDYGQYYNYAVYEENVDYTGMYIGGGLMFRLSDEKKKAAKWNETKW